MTDGTLYSLIVSQGGIVREDNNETNQINQSIGQTRQESKQETPLSLSVRMSTSKPAGSLCPRSY